jgi:ubiquitin-like 1-activating enzyme E1 B
MSEDRYSVYRAIYGDDGFEKLQKSKVLIVGAGGIGCEILKNMVLMGYKNLELIDLDTIDVSNLNRQFLFRTEHVGRPKAEVASEAAMHFNPDCHIKYHYNNIKDDQFNVAYMKTFDCVLNALDNVDARRHVNRLCLSAGVPLIDSGSTGYQGQVRPIMKGITECYECREKPTQKVYPICTIRSTPDKPVHCIVWAKEAFKLIYGKTEESMLYEDPAVENDSTFMKYASLKFAASDFGLDTTHMSSESGVTTVVVETIVNRIKLLIKALFCDEIDKRLSTGVYDNAKTRPRIMAYDDIDRAANKAIVLLSEAFKLSSTSNTRPRDRHDWDKNVWSDEECAIESIMCMAAISIDDYITTNTAQPSMLGKMTFDKDDHDTMIFVTSFANMRSRVFNIPPQCLYDAKGMAGNIIPAIATTNAIVAATQVEQACQVIIEGNSVISSLRNTSVWRIPASRGRFVLNPLKYCEEPISTCFVCQKNPLYLVVDTHVETLDYFITKILKGKLGFNAPNIELGASPIYEEGEGCDEDFKDNLPLLLKDCPAGGIHQDSELTIDDFTQDMNVVIIIKHLSTKEILKQLQYKSALNSGITDEKEQKDIPPPDDAFYFDGPTNIPKPAPVAADQSSPKKHGRDVHNSSANSSSPNKRHKGNHANTADVVIEL